ncbi:Hypothetical predicted protein [Paramuricea clavata]|nr:Hypothetical predicted protein [Paramuricea clavata]
MYNQGSDHQKAPPNYPQPDNLVSRHDPALQRHGSEGGFYPPPQLGRDSYPPPQPSGGGYPPPDAYPSFPVHQQPGNTVHNTNTTVVIQQQPAAVIVQGRDWSTGMCACCDDCGVCLLGWCCPCILQCMVSSKAGECCCVAALCPIALRTKIRTRHNIVGSIVGDYYALQCCAICALCQMARELNLHGI